MFSYKTHIIATFSVILLNLLHETPSQLKLQEKLDSICEIIRTTSNNSRTKTIIELNEHYLDGERLDS